MAIAAIHSAKALASKDRSRGWAALDILFRNGTLPAKTLDGRYQGELVLINVAPGFTHFLQALTTISMPWSGKTFSHHEDRGDNIFTRDSLLLAHMYWPAYRGYRKDGLNTYRAFTFRTNTGPGLADPDRQVLRIDYDLPENPRWTIRRVLDEIIQIDDGLYLGKAHFCWWWGRWSQVAFFMLRANG